MTTTYKRFVPFDLTKVDEDQHMVYGYASTEAEDSQGEIVKLDALKSAFGDYMKFANIREMHQPSAVGTTKEYEITSKGAYIGAKIVDKAAWEKVKEGVYKGFSIGGKIVAKSDNEITELSLHEISLVDRPANPEAVFDVYKAEGPGEKEEVTTEVTVTETIVETKEEPAATAEIIEQPKEEVATESATETEEGKPVEQSAKATNIKKDVGTAASLAYDASDLEYLIDWRKKNNQPVDHLVAALEALKAAAVTEITDSQTGDNDGDVEMAAKNSDLEKYKMPTDEEITKALEAQGMPVNEQTISITKLSIADQIMGEITKNQAAGMDIDLAKAEVEKEMAKVLGNMTELLKSEIDKKQKIAPFVYYKMDKVEATASDISKSEGEEKEDTLLQKSESTNLNKVEGTIAKLEDSLAKAVGEISSLKERILKFEQEPVEPRLRSSLVVERFVKSENDTDSESLQKEIDSVSESLAADPSNQILRKQANELTVKWQKLQHTSN